MNRITRLSLLVLVVLTAVSCAVKKYIPEGKYLYRGGNIIIKDTAEQGDYSDLREQLADVLFPEPNSKTLGMYPGLHFHYKAQQEHPGFITRFLNKKLGEKPAYLSDVSLKATKDLLQNRLENNGYFYGHIGSSTEKDTAQKTATIDYTVTIGKPYRLDRYEIEKDSADTSGIYRLIKNAMAQTDLKKGTRFSLDTMKTERQRIDQYLKDLGYYYFSDDYILFQADTNIAAHKQYNLYLKLKEGTPDKSKVPYVIDSVEVFPQASVKHKTRAEDTTRFEGIDFIQNPVFFKPKRLKPFILLKPGQKYNPETSSYTSRRLASIGTYKFVNIRYREVDTTTDNQGNRHLKSIISLAPLPQNAFRINIQGVTKSNDFTGPGVNLTYTNRNIFKGGENFNVKGIFGYEKQFYSGNQRGASSLHLGLKTSLLFPRMLFPGNFKKQFRYAIPKTKISAGFDYLRRSRLYSLNSFSAAFGYIWHQNRFVTHKLKPLNVDYVKLNHTSPEFEALLNHNPFLRHSFEQQFIEGVMYTFIYNELMEKQKRGRFYFRFNFDIAGNLVSLFGQPQSDGIKTFLGLKYAQYVKGDIDVSYHYALGRNKKTALVARLFAGLGIPYGNSRELPYVKQYFSGGPYSVRAFRIRSIGPGAYKPEDEENSYFEQAGDIRLEANLEYRFPIISIVKGAVFADAGNVWLQKKNPELPGGAFSDRFLNQLGVGAGVGLRFDVQGFVLRFDLAAPLKRPAEHWDFEYKKPVFNFAIGYPF